MQAPAQPMPWMRPPPGGMLSLIGGGDPPMPMPPSSDEQTAKRSRMEEILIPEHQWLHRVNGTTTIHVQTPHAEEWSLDVKKMSVHLEVTSQVWYWAPIFCPVGAPLNMVLAKRLGSD